MCSKEGAKSRQRRLFVHIGLEKTGTTTLQHFLHDNAVALAAAGFSYLADRRAPYFSYIAHTPVTGALIEAPDFLPTRKLRTLPQALATLATALASEPLDVILSSEHLSSRLSTPPQLEQLRAAFGTRETTIVCYVRRQDEMALSAYSTGVKAGRRDAFDHRAITPANCYFNHFETLDLWARVFGDAALRVRNVARPRLVNGDIRDDFAALVGLGDLGSWHRAKDANVSLDALQLAILRRVNKVLPRYGEVPHWLYRAVTKARRNSLIPLLPRGRPLSWLTREAAPGEIMARFRAGNLELERRFMQPGELSDWYS